MTDKRWKATERAVAERLGGKRIPITGRQRGATADATSRGNWLSPEIKDRAKLPNWLMEALSQAIAAVRGDQIPIVILHEKGQFHDNDLVLVRLHDWCDLVGNLRVSSETTEGF